MPNEGFGTLLLNGIEDIPQSIEPFYLGVAYGQSIEPFDILGAKAFSASIEPFDIVGSARGVSIEPFDLGTKVSVPSVEPFDILGASDSVYPPTDLGDGVASAGDVGPTYGWWEGLPDAPVDVGTIVTD